MGDRDAALARHFRVQAQQREGIAHIENQPGRRKFAAQFGKLRGAEGLGKFGKEVQIGVPRLLDLAQLPRDAVGRVFRRLQEQEDR